MDWHKHIIGKVKGSVEPIPKTTVPPRPVLYPTPGLIATEYGFDSYAVVFLSETPVQLCLADPRRYHLLFSGSYCSEGAISLNATIDPVTGLIDYVVDQQPAFEYWIYPLGDVHPYVDFFGIHQDEPLNLEFNFRDHTATIQREWWGVCNQDAQIYVLSEWWKYG
jgi:hypothetical protein